jgi:hypothetical protein
MPAKLMAADFAYTASLPPDTQSTNLYSPQLLLCAPIVDISLRSEHAQMRSGNNLSPNAIPSGKITKKLRLTIPLTSLANFRYNG